MLKTLIKVLVLVAAIGASFSLSAAGTVQAGSSFGPSIEGVSYAEIAQWQSRYAGGAFHGCDFPPPPYCGPAYSHPEAVQKPPSPCRVPKSKRGKSRK